MVATQFDRYQQCRQTLLDTLERQVGLLSALHMETWANRINSVRQRTAGDAFKVMVVGEFNRGKSTFINAMLGQKILPAYAVPTTAIINELHYGPAPKAYLYDIVPDGDPPRRQEIPVADLQRYVVANDADGDRGKPYEKVALIWPLDLCRDGVELIDAPGLNADPIHQRITMDYLTRSDAVIFTIACDFPLSASERDMIKSIHDLHHDDIFFVCNRINMIEGDETEPVRQRLLKLLAPETRHGARRIYFIDARAALNDRMRHDESQLAATGVPAVEDDLKDFLATDRGRLKLARPAQEAQEAVREARKTIRATEQMLRSDLDALQRRYEQAREPLRQLEQERQNIGLNILSFSRLLRIDASDEANRFFRSVVERIPGWAATLDPDNALGMFSALSTQRREALIAEIVRRLTGNVEAAFQEWQRQTLMPMMEERFETALMPMLRQRISAFDAHLEQVKFDIAGEALAHVAKSGDVPLPPLWERVAAGIGPLLFGDFVGGAMGGLYGFKTMAANLAIQGGIAVASILLTGGLSAVVIVPAFITSALAQGYIRGGQVTDKIKDRVTDEYASAIERSRDEMVGRIASAIEGQIGQIQAKVDEALGMEVATLHERVEAVLQVKEGNRHAADETITRLHAIAQALDQQDTLVGEIIRDYAVAQ